MKKLSFTLILFGLIALLPACKKQDSNDVNQDKIWTQYAVSYDKNNDVTDVVARFRFGSATGTLLQLTDSTGTKITFNGQAMPYSTVWSGHHLQFAGNVTNGSFKYTNTEGTVYTNSIAMGADSIAFPTSFDTIDQSQASTFYWVGKPLSPNQSMGIYVGTWAWDEDAAFFTDANGATSVVLGKQEKSGLAPGTATVYMARFDVNSNVNGPSVGGEIKYTYKVEKSGIQIVP